MLTTLPSSASDTVDYPLTEGMFLIFAGHRWCVLSVDQQHKVVDVSKAAAGRVPKFSGNGGLIYDPELKRKSRINEGIIQARQLFHVRV